MHQYVLRNKKPTVTIPVKLAMIALNCSLPCAQAADMHPDRGDRDYSGDTGLTMENKRSPDGKRNDGYWNRWDGQQRVRVSRLYHRYFGNSDG